MGSADVFYKPKRGYLRKNALKRFGNSHESIIFVFMEISLKSKTYGVKVCLIDDEDYVKIKDYIWCIVPNRKTFYAMSRIKLRHKKYKTVRMHQLLIDGSPIDHKDGNGLNNTKDNLRKATMQQNNFNVPLTARNRSGFKGVYKTPYNRYIACIRVSGKLIHGGSFGNGVDAAKRYNELARIHHGDFAWLNPV